MPLTDEEVEELKRSAREAKAAATAAQQAQAEMTRAYQADMRIIGDKLFRDQPAAATPAADNDADPEEVTLEKVNRIVEQRIAAPAAAIGQSIIALARSNAERALPEFNRYAAEIDSLVVRALQANPQQATNPDVYRHAYDVVRLQHQDEIIAERTKAALKDRLAEYGVEAEEEEEAAVTVEAESTAPAPPAAPARRQPLSEPVTAAGSGAGRPLAPLRKRSASRLSEEQEFVNNKLGMREADKFDQYADPRYSPDILGLRGRERV